MRWYGAFRKQNCDFKSQAKPCVREWLHLLGTWFRSVADKFDTVVMSKFGGKSGFVDTVCSLLSRKVLRILYHVIQFGICHTEKGMRGWWARLPGGNFPAFCFLPSQRSAYLLFPETKQHRFPSMPLPMMSQCVEGGLDRLPNVPWSNLLSSGEIWRKGRNI